MRPWSWSERLPSWGFIRPWIRSPRPPVPWRPKSSARSTTASRVQCRRCCSATKTCRISLRFSAYELSPEDKVTVLRARKVQRFLSQPFSVAQVFTGREGKQVPVAETVRGFKEILEGKHDAVAEGDFYMKGGIDEVRRS